MSTEEPIIKLEEGGQASIVSYNVPEPTSYKGRFFIDLELKQNYFKPIELGNNKDTGSTIPSSPNTTEMEESTLKTIVVKGMKTGFADGRFFPNLRLFSDAIRFVEKPNSHSEFELVTQDRVSSKLANLNPDEVVSMMKVGKQLNIYRSMYGTLTYNYVSGDDSRTSLDNIPSGLVSYVRNQFISIVSPSDGQTLSGPSPITINVTVIALPIISGLEDTGGKKDGTGSLEEPTGSGSGTRTVVIDVKTVSIKVGSKPKKTVNANSGQSEYSFRETITGQGEETINIIASATYADPSARPDTSATIVVRFTPSGPGADTTKPSITITSPVDGATLPPGDYRGIQVNVTGTASDNVGVKNVDLTLDDDALAYTPATPSSPGNWANWSGTKLILRPGAHKITARCTDNAGNTEVDTITVTANILPTPSESRLLLVEKYRLSSFLGNYGAGRVVKTFSLLPGEKTKISVKTYTRREQTRTEASSILDSFTEESAKEFESTLGSEQSDKRNHEESYKWNVDTHAEAGWGFGSASVDAGFSGGSNSAREEFSKNVSSATQTHASRASAKRDVQINTSYEVREEAGEETSIEREIENINVSRTLNFVFRQMNQEFITILHLIDARVALVRKDYIIGNPTPVQTYREATLPQLDAFLHQVLVDDDGGAMIRGVRDFILLQLANIFDYNDKHHIFYEETNFKDANGNNLPGSNYLRVKKNLISRYVDPATKTAFAAPGIIMSAEKYVLRTEGVIVEALLGRANSLDVYSQGLQREAIRSKQLDNEKIRIANRIVIDKDKEAARIYEQVFPCCEKSIYSLWPPKNNENEHDGE